ncbi:hypothetical protein LCGC14_2608680 [marine sediment metagenome]|uniref:Uncharacterized protein n=1 Tax=marine sediment metagenome TaxID=412755 RepID=A0A0F9A6Q8_9ZZZZ
MENEIIVSGKSIRVIKETERGIIILFRSETIQNVTVEKSSEPYCDDDRNNNNNNIIEEEEQEENEIKSSSKKRSNEKTDSSNKKKKSKSITKYKDYYLCGDLCSEITSPLIIYTIKIKKNDYNDLYIISEIVNFNLEFRLPLTKKILKQSLIKSEYFYGLPTKIINDLLNPLDTTYRLSLNGPILEERILNCLFCGEKGKILRYICKNIFKDKKYYERVSSYGNVALSQLCESELKILELNPNDDRKELELIILGDDIDKEVKVRLGDLSGISDPIFGSISGYGLYTENAYLKGHISASSAFFSGNIISEATMSGGYIIGSTIKTAETSNRVELHANRSTFEVYNSAGNIVAYTSESDASFDGHVSLAAGFGGISERGVGIGIPFDEITVYKPLAEYYIDDRAIRFGGDWEQTMQQVVILEKHRANKFE